ncbi:hypothetical protein GQ44DRAFT_729267 [Phaeosphaeriaceae sp. PMI808]|nr:hypothetical protein GQ44DRAFT_729267 [Phaeosphaeriaceae sp. PMI808]
MVFSRIGAGYLKYIDDRNLWMIFRSNGRFKQFDPITATSAWWDIASKNKCHTVAYDLDNTAGWAKAYVVELNYVDLKGYLAAKSPKDRVDWKISQLNVAFTMDFCNWYLHELSLNGWLRIDKTLVMKTQQPDFKRGTLPNATPIDGLRMAGPICYGWKCIQDIKNPNNADSVAMIVLALYIWILGFYVDKDGNVMNK